MTGLVVALLLAAPADRLPKPSDLSCFPCHSAVKFERGEPFAHAGAHRSAGHCHVCHQGSGHEGRAIDRGACLSCHKDGSAALKILAAGMGKETPAAAPAAGRKHAAGGAMQCVTCHNAPLFDPAALSKSVHAKLACNDCHKGFDFSFARGKPPAQDDALIAKLAGRSTAPAALAACGGCHESQKDDWTGSVHGRFLREARPVAGATCIDCHGDAHAIQKSSAKPTFAQRAGMSGQCIGCHENKELTEKAGLSDRPGKSFRDSVHGRMIALQNDRAPGCANCHGAHDIAPVASPASMVSPQNKVSTCAECHKGANATFAALFTHKPIAARPGPHGTEVAFSWLTAVVLTLLVVHVVLDLGNEIRHWLRRRRGLENGHEQPAEPKSVVRFDRHQLIQHWLLIASVVTLVLSDWPVRMAGVGASLSIVNFLGGVKAAGIIHRTAGIVMGVAALYHLIYLTTLAIRRDKFLSMLPSMKDLKDVWGNGAYFLGLAKERPRFDRFAYFEKFDYWAVFWGVVIMFGTGLVRWFPVWFSTWLPAGVVEGCEIAHGDEATLAALVLFTWHLYNVHLKPAIFPMSWVWLDGRIDVETLREEHRAEYDQLMAKAKPATGGTPGK